MQNNPGPDQQYYGNQQGNYPTPPPQGKTQVLGLDYNIAGLLCYVPFGFIPAIVFLVTEPKESRFVRFHSLQSLLFIAFMVVLNIVLSIVGAVAGNIPGVGLIFALLMLPLSLLIFLGSLVLMALLIIKAYQKQMWKIPIIGDQAERIANS